MSLTCMRNEPPKDGSPRWPRPTPWAPAILEHMSIRLAMSCKRAPAASPESVSGAVNTGRSPLPPDICGCGEKGGGRKAGASGSDVSAGECSSARCSGGGGEVGQAERDNGGGKGGRGGSGATAGDF